ncbi:sensor histidine kinase [Sphaerisporangium corydalis]|uniref:histidine kinase n=1 Tax=Sphaerisporangium corydalis TaxID=1441875 RepID=A0ABV9EN11_9ACTN|nr:HAMP domain-containing sensor histidine kinase [Sphaerisporangium corydalis]
MWSGLAAAVAGVLLSVLLLVLLHSLATARLVDLLDGAAGRIALDLERGNIRGPLLSSGYVKVLQVVDAQGRVMAASAALQGKAALPQLIHSPTVPGAVITDCGNAIPGGSPCDLIVERQVYLDGATWSVYSSAPPIPALVDPSVAVLLVAGVAGIIAAVTFSCFRVVGACLHPVGLIHSQLDEINATSLTARVPVPRYDDELRALADSLNLTLGRLQQAVEKQRRFASDVCHDLRNPVTAMRVEVEDAMAAPDVALAPHVCACLLGNLDRLQAIIADLLALARLDAEPPPAREPVDLAELVTAEVAGRRTALRIERRLQQGVVVLGDRLRLCRLLGNLLANAERHARGVVVVTVYRDGPAPEARAVLEVLDDGAGIAPGERDIVFQRFVRLSESRQRDPGGTGLGLPIARQIAEMSGGTLTIEDTPTGARFVLKLPPAPTP